MGTKTRFAPCENSQCHGLPASPLLQAQGLGPEGGVGIWVGPAGGWGGGRPGTPRRGEACPRRQAWQEGHSAPHPRRRGRPRLGGQQGVSGSGTLRDEGPEVVLGREAWWLLPAGLAAPAAPRGQKHRSLLPSLSRPPHALPAPLPLRARVGSRSSSSGSPWPLALDLGVHPIPVSSSESSKTSNVTTRGHSAAGKGGGRRTQLGGREGRVTPALSSLRRMPV